MVTMDNEVSTTGPALPGAAPSAQEDEGSLVRAERGLMGALAMAKRRMLERDQLSDALGVEQLARAKAEAQRDRLEAALRDVDGAIFTDPQVIHNAATFRLIIVKALADLGAASTQAGWQPIETAQHIWHAILVYAPAAGISIAYRRRDGAWVIDDGTRKTKCPWRLTHWMPLPSPPTGGDR